MAAGAAGAQGSADLDKPLEFRYSTVMFKSTSLVALILVAATTMVGCSTKKTTVTNTTPTSTTSKTTETTETPLEAEKTTTTTTTTTPPPAKP